MTQQFRFKDDVRPLVAHLCDAMMFANSVNRDNYADQRSGTYGMCYMAICDVVRKEAGVDIDNEGWNLGGNTSFLADVEACVDKVLRRRVVIRAVVEITVDSAIMESVRYKDEEGLQDLRDHINIRMADGGTRSTCDYLRDVHSLGDDQVTCSIKVYLPGEEIA